MGLTVSGGSNRKPLDITRPTDVILSTTQVVLSDNQLTAKEASTLSAIMQLCKLGNSHAGKMKMRSIKVSS